MKDRRETAKLTSLDFIAMLMFTVAFFVAVIIGLGSHKAPESEGMLNPATKETEIVIDIGQSTYISNIEIFLGHKSNPKLWFSYYDEENKEWVTVASEVTIPSAFAWNTVDFNTQCRYIGIVTSTDEAYIREIILKDNEGKIVTPNSSEKTRLYFDEQNTYPGYPTYYNMTMFDEVYHGRTAYEFLNDLPIYENTHPPLGKTLISIGIAIFGMNPFGWRIVVAIFGILVIPLIYLFAFNLTKETRYAIFATLLAFTEFMHFTLSRIATIDMIVALFILLSFYFIYRFGEDLKQQREFKYFAIDLTLCGLSCGLAIATKWTGFYSSFGVAILLFVYLISYTRQNGGFAEQKGLWGKLALLCVGVFLVIPFGIYTLSYLPFKDVYPGQSLIELMWNNAKHMLSYHNSVNDAHPYASRWYQWLVDCKPLLDSWKGTEDGTISAVATFGNPIIVWGGLLAFFYNIVLWFKEKNREAMTLVIAYLVMFLPWVFIGRTTFIYQYFLCIMIMILLIVNAVKNLPKGNVGVMLAIAIASVIMFVIFYPIISGAAVPRDYLRFLEWLPTWTFN